MEPGRVEWRARELSARALLGMDHAARIANAGSTDHAADDHERASHPDAYAERFE